MRLMEISRKTNKDLKGDVYKDPSPFFSKMQPLGFMFQTMRPAGTGSQVNPPFDGPHHQRKLRL